MGAPTFESLWESECADGDTFIDKEGARNFYLDGAKAALDAAAREVRGSDPYADTVRERIRAITPESLAGAEAGDGN